MEKIQDKKDVLETEFERILNTLRNENETLNFHTSKTYSYANCIKSIEKTEDISDPVIKTPTNIVESLWAEIYKIRQVNAKLNILNSHLDELIPL